MIWNWKRKRQDSSANKAARDSAAQRDSDKSVKILRPITALVLHAAHLKALWERQGRYRRIRKCPHSLYDATKREGNEMPTMEDQGVQ